jgi:histidyl-tRNA synthetase
VDKKDDKGLDEFLDEINAPDEMRGKLFRLIGLRGINAMHEARELVGDIEAISQFESLLELLDVYGLEYQVDMGIARGLDYYTGMVFEIYCEGLGAQNQVCGGGSYRLAQLFGGEDTPSTGYAIGFDRVMEICKVEYQPQIRAAVICFDDTRNEAIKITKELRDAGFATYLDLMGRKFKDQLTHINTIDNARYEQVLKLFGNLENTELEKTFAIIVGTNELKTGKYPLKDMAKREQVLLTKLEIMNRLKEESEQLNSIMEGKRILSR